MQKNIYKKYLDTFEDIDLKIRNFPDVSKSELNNDFIERLNQLSDSEKSTLNQLYDTANKALKWANTQDKLKKEKEERNRTILEENAKKLRLKEKADLEEKANNEKIYKTNRYAKFLLAVTLFLSVALSGLSAFLLAFGPAIGFLVFLFICFYPKIYTILLMKLIAVDTDMELQNFMPDSFLNLPGAGYFFEKMAPTAVKWISNDDSYLLFITSCIYYPIPIITFIFLLS